MVLLGGHPGRGSSGSSLCAGARVGPTGSCGSRASSWNLRCSWAGPCGPELGSTSSPGPWISTVSSSHFRLAVSHHGHSDSRKAPCKAGLLPHYWWKCTMACLLWGKFSVIYQITNPAVSWPSSHPGSSHLCDDTATLFVMERLETPSASVGQSFNKLQRRLSTTSAPLRSPCLPQSAVPHLVCCGVPSPVSSPVEPPPVPREG
ncbi:uncharacterized protein LOC126951631 [Macaca thibetana thibetana]|uniref:uncharacterized protein LOC126951631 n=1 Tax=Macaca thibetana thibetana TaxID=257877 RepID=UPI0021BCBB5A|nr:uncharacterized protein LOC126951631 [Macaca thibetana thibetana]